MAQYTTEAIVLGVKNWGNADKIVYLLSPTRGKITAVAYGCRRPKSVLAAAMQPFSWLEVQLTEGDRLDTVKQCEHKGFFPGLYDNLEAMAYSSFVTELARELTVEGEPQQEIYELLLKILPVMSQRNPRLCALAAAYQLYEHTGLQLQYHNCALCGMPIERTAHFDSRQGGAVCKHCEPLASLNYELSLQQFIDNLLKLNWEDIQAFSVTGKNLQMAEQILLRYTRELFGKNFKSLDFIKQVTAIC